MKIRRVQRDSNRGVSRASRQQRDRPPGIVSSDPGPKRTMTTSSQNHVDKIQSGSAMIPKWTTWESLALEVRHIPADATVLTLWQAFHYEGELVSIDIFEDRDSAPGKPKRGKIRFKPPPRREFWRLGKFSISLPDGRQTPVYLYLNPQDKQQYTPSPINPEVQYPAEVTVSLASIDLGVSDRPASMLSLRTISKGIRQFPRLTLDLRKMQLILRFQIAIFDYRRAPGAPDDIFHDYRIRIQLSQLRNIMQIDDDEAKSTSHIIVLDLPPLYHRRLKNIASTFEESKFSWREEDSWFRQTDIVSVASDLARLPVSLRKRAALVNIGRWTTFRLNYSSGVESNETFKLLCRAFNDFNISIEKVHEFEVQDRSQEMVTTGWDIVDPPDNLSSKPSSLDDLSSDDYIHLPFPVRYQLEVCISHGYLNEYTINREFVRKLVDIGEQDGLDLLEYIFTEKKICQPSISMFNIKVFRGLTTLRIPSYCCYMRSAVVTPGTIYFNPPTIDTSNRVLRRYIEFADRFLRLRFTDEKLEGRINSIEGNTMNEVFTRIKRALANGITLGDRHYEFLAFGNSQFREHGAYFFASVPQLTASNIRDWMGQFHKIRNVAKYAARLGQCFSTTRAITGCSVQICNIEDVEGNGFTFSDGVGRMSKFLSQMVGTELKIKMISGEAPSAYQFRLGGCKGMLVVSPQAHHRELHIRPSQIKFPSNYSGLEIIRWSQFSMAALNRQLIILLSTVGIQDEVFHRKLRLMLENLDEAMISDAHAIHLLEKYIDPNQMTLNISTMIRDGFQRVREPFVASLLQLWRAWQIKYLKEKAKIVIEDAACVLGVMDEIGVLKGYEQSKLPTEDAEDAVRLQALPEIFLQITPPDKSENPAIIEGPCILARNPSLHPGDIRIVMAVNVPELHNLRDVVVFPQKGDRDIPSMCSGGDLDGDDYLIIWDKDLLPTEWFREPMDYSAKKAKDLDRDVTVNDVTSFFVTYMKNDCLPRIAHAHLAFADKSPLGVEDPKCIALAKLHSDAVDYNKSGIPARLTRDLRPRVWPHYMEKKHQPKERIYHSEKILGQLYDAVERVDFAPNLEMPFDERIIMAEIQVSDKLMTFSKDLKESYDCSMRKIMAQHQIKTEFEVWSTFVLAHANMSKDYRFHEEIGAISAAFRQQYRKKCLEHVGERSFESLAPLVVAMYRVTHMEMQAALEKLSTLADTDFDEIKNNFRSENFPLISFPWIFPEILGKIAMRNFDPEADFTGMALWESAKGENHSKGRLDLLDTMNTQVQLIDLDDQQSPDFHHLKCTSEDNDSCQVPQPHSFLDDNPPDSCDTVSGDLRPTQQYRQVMQEGREILENEDDVKPNALDMLERLLNINDD